jgi:hypothetical protein
MDNLKLAPAGFRLHIRHRERGWRRNAPIFADQTGLPG